ncbi:hypothetical protein JVT61DRAFT_13836 [Boletus reticuloceps]|uniref:Uncharacterized protein n=1 Tax=Boletus reticuloceps TaxID=495285 RepID=A0A8I2YWF4_9AGAM|nr:hypothetical protein JVT61DRAFT_13836 [Boletus reticuloceps]
MLSLHLKRQRPHYSRDGDETASAEEVNLNAPHAPHQNAIEAFNHVLHIIKREVIQSRRNWDKHEPKMWSRAAELSDAVLTHFTIEQDLVQVRSGFVSYGTIILGKIRVPAVNDEMGKGYIHVRCVSQCSATFKLHLYDAHMPTNIHMGVCQCRCFRS